MRLCLWAAGNIGRPVTAREALAEVGALGTWLVVGRLEGTLVEEGTVAWVLVESITLALAEVCWVDWCWKESIVYVVVLLHIPIPMLCFKYII